MVRKELGAASGKRAKIQHLIRALFLNAERDPGITHRLIDLCDVLGIPSFKQADDVHLMPRERGMDREAAMREYLTWEIKLVDDMASDDDHRFSE